MQRIARTAMLSTALLGCAPGQQTLRPEAWFPPPDSSASRRPLDCSDLQPPAPAGSIGDPIDPGRGTGLKQPADLRAGAVRLVWSSTVSGVRLDWVAPAGADPKSLWTLRVADSGRCVVGTWNTSQLGFQVVRHVFAREGRIEVVLLGLGPPPRRGWMVLVTDGARLWSGLDSKDGRPGAILAEEAQLYEEGSQLRLVVVDEGRTGARTFDGIHFETHR
jgi:hypothetical protein